MINKDILNGLKGYRSSNDNLYHIADIFPKLLGNLLRIISVFHPPIYNVNLIYNPKDFYKFQINLSYAIANYNFDTLDNLVLEFIETYYYGIEPNIAKLKLGEEEKKKFIDTCNNFKGKQWNDIIGPFIDSLNDLLATGSINGMQISLG